jgi:NADPH-dependent curcumin reductase CurA
MGTLGMPGLTSYVGLFKFGEPKAGDTVFVSAASGAVGANVCQIAKLKGCRVIGSCGSDEKAQWLKDECGVDEVINYKTCGDLSAALAAAAPEGIDVYFENVGGDHLQAAINSMNPYGRIAACGMISGYNAANPEPGPNNLMLIVGKKIRITGFIVSDHVDMRDAFLSEMIPWIQAGKIKSHETVVEGIGHAVDAFLGLFSGNNFGKMVVKL